MKNYKMTIQYDGTKYNGWQRQGNTQNTIEEKIENVLYKMTNAKTEVFASGRTDRGVHAKCQVASFKCNTQLECDDIKNYLNNYLPEDILITSLEQADERFHARLNAKSKTYVYTIATQKPDVFVRKYVYHSELVPDVQKMIQASNKFLGTHDFKGFCSDKTKKSTVRTINSIKIEEGEGLITITINGSGFLYNMVRIIAGTLFDIGLGKLDQSVIDTVFKTRERQLAGTTLPARGLMLFKVFYE